MAKEIKLTQGKVAIVDDDSFEFLSQWKWTASLGSRGRKWYAIRREYTGERGPTGVRLRRRVAMHRVLMKCPDGMVVDHLNGNPLDNRAANLEIVTQKTNMERAPNWCRKPQEVWL